jgi:integrase
MSPALARVLREHREQGHPADWVFTSRDGTKPIGATTFDRAWRRLRSRHFGPPGIPPLRLHCARHTWATLAFHAGKSVSWVQRQPGHSDPETTLRIYAHAMPESAEDLGFVDFEGVARRATTEQQRTPAPIRSIPQPREEAG